MNTERSCRGMKAHSALFSLAKVGMPVRSYFGGIEVRGRMILLKGDWRFDIEGILDFVDL